MESKGGLLGLAELVGEGRDVYAEDTGVAVEEKLGCGKTNAIAAAGENDYLDTVSKLLCHTGRGA